MSWFFPALYLFHPGALGDGLLSLKSVRILRKRFPDHLMVWFGHKEIGKVLVACQEVHLAYSFDDVHLLIFRTSGAFKRRASSDLFDRCTHVVGWMDDSDGTWNRYFSESGIEATIVRSPHDPTLRAHHMADRYLEILGPWLMAEHAHLQFKEDYPEDLPLAIPNTEKRDSSDSSQGPLIVLHPGSGSPHKCVPSGILAKLASDLLAVSGRKLYVVGGPADDESVRQLQTVLTSCEVNVLQGLDLLDMSRLIKQAHLFIGHDSGLSHLAACLGIPSLLFFGPTDSSRWAPRGAHVVIMRNVCQCHKEDEIKRCTDKHCLSFSLDHVLQKVENLLSRRQISAVSGSCLIS